MDPKYGDKGCIDVKAMYAAEKKKRDQSAKILQLAKEAVFNLLQDMRHLLILDTRTEEEFKISHIRGSFHFPLENVEGNLPEFVKCCKLSQEKMVDQTDDHRRLLLVTADSTVDLDPIRPLLKEAQAFHKIMQLKDSFKDFEEKYSFLCVGEESSEDDIKRAEARYPSEIIPNKLFLGNFINSLNERHFHDLNIRKIIGMTPNKAEKMDEGPQIDKYIHLEMNELHKPDLDFEELSTLINTTISEGEGAVLLYCLQGNMSAAV